MQPSDPAREPGPAGRRSVASVWLEQRSKAWIWAGAFVVVVLAAVVLLFGLDPEPAASGQRSGQSLSHQFSEGGGNAGGRKL